MRSILILLIALTAAGCDRTYVINPGGGTTPVSPTPTPTDTSNKIEYRVVGTANSVRVRYSNPQDGLSQIVTTLPFNVSFNTEQKTLFVSLEATPISYISFSSPNFMNIQIVANGSLFREASSSDSLFTPLSISGTWRK